MSLGCLAHPYGLHMRYYPVFCSPLTLLPPMSLFKIHFSPPRHETSDHPLSPSTHARYARDANLSQPSPPRPPAPLPSSRRRACSAARAASGRPCRPLTTLCRPFRPSSTAPSSAISRSEYELSRRRTSLSVPPFDLGLASCPGRDLSSYVIEGELTPRGKPVALASQLSSLAASAREEKEKNNTPL